MLYVQYNMKVQNSLQYPSLLCFQLLDKITTSPICLWSLSRLVWLLPHSVGGEGGVNSAFHQRHYIVFSCVSRAWTGYSLRKSCFEDAAGLCGSRLKRQLTEDVQAEGSPGEMILCFISALALASTSASVTVSTASGRLWGTEVKSKKMWESDTQGFRYCFFPVGPLIGPIRLFKPQFCHLENGNNNIRLTR